MPLSAGDHLGPYIIIEPLGTGGMGEVHRARDPRLNRDVAIKTLRASSLADPDWRSRFTQEARAVSALSHPNIVTMHDIGTEGDVAYMVMELVDGQTLDRMIPAGGMRVGDILRSGAQIADACARAHASGVIHRDLKPSNVIVQPDGRVRVLDFGIAKLMAPADAAGGAAADATGTSPGVVLGTAAYMSPEQAEGRGVDARSDIFSFGAMLYEMCAGQRPFRGDSAVAVMAAVVQQDPAPLATVRPDLPSELARLINRCLRKDPARRVQSMADLKVALEELRDDADSGRLTAQSGPVTVPGKRRAMVFVASAAALAVAVAGVISWRTWRSTPVAASEPVPVPLTTFPGSEGDPTLSPDGTQVAFRWSGADDKNDDIYVMSIGGGSPLRITTDPRSDYGSKWSPDGRRLAFLRVLDGDRVAVILVPPLGGAERTVAELWTSHALNGSPLATMCWTPDSRYLFLAASDQPGDSNKLLRLTIETGELLSIAVAPYKGRGFSSPDLSPDGHTLAVALTDAPEAVQLVSLSDTYEPRGTKAVPGIRNVFYVHWTPDGRDLLVNYFIDVPQPLFRVPATGGEPVPLSWVGPGARGEVSIRGGRMVFDRAARDTNLVRLDLQSAAAGGVPTVDRIAQSSFRDVAPQYSPDGTRLAFYSNRSGSVQIWTANADGTQPVQLTSMDPLSTTASPRWSPDGRDIAFDCNTGGAYQLYVVPSTGGKPRVVTSGTASNFGATWSRDGRWIYFSSVRDGNDIWRVRPEGGDAERVTHVGAVHSAFSRDGKTLFFARKDGADGIWKMPTEGGEPVKVADRVFRYNYVVAERGIYYIRPRENAAGGVLRFVDLASGASRDVYTIDKPLDLGLALSRDGRYLVYAQVDYAGQDLMIVDNFR